MWKLSVVHNAAGNALWFSDAKPLDNVRGGDGVSSRLIVDTQGFIDFTELSLPPSTILDINSAFIPFGSASSPSTVDIQDIEHPWVDITLNLPGDGTFTASAHFNDTTSATTVSVSGKVKPLPSISASDAAFLEDMRVKEYIPYQKIPDAPGKTMQEIEDLGKQLFPFSPHSFQLALSVYDWTTASFARMVFMEIFQYTSIAVTPFPLDQPSIATEIWESNWGSYVPSDAVYMNSFMMKPAASQQEVASQLASVAPQLHEFSNVQNRLFTAAVQSFPRTSVITKPHLFSGQVDIYQLGLDHFGIEFLECPLNAGPVTQSLQINFASATSSYISAGNVITTKMVWSFTDSMDDAMHYQNGIILVANVPDDRSWVWETAAHITPLSDDPAKTEYTFVPGSRFKVLSISQATVQDKQVAVINLQPLPPTMTVPSGPNRRDELPVAPLTAEAFTRKASAYSPVLEQQVQLLHERDVKEKVISLDGAIPLHRKHPDATHFKLGHKTRGRRCACIDALEKMLA
ncbi:hypothetical protein EIP86_006453 [Pleurotus ostreatoroseus]|nr:hypothetical protein EIP86_006453 [Pleurotus ostreatoroseus]